MKAVDTNIVARFVIGDDPVQAQRAAEILAGPCFVPSTVLLETAWLLSSRFGLDRATVAETLRDLLRLPLLTAPSADQLDWALDRFEAGADFADMLHIVFAVGADSFVSFEKHLARYAGPDTPLPIETLT